MRQMDAMAGKLRQIEGKMIEQGMKSTSSDDYVVRFFSSSTSAFLY